MSGMSGGMMSGGMMSGGMMSGGMMSGGMMSGGMSGGMMSGMGGGTGGRAALNTESPYDAIVEIYGIIYIYNPVDPAKLGIETDCRVGQCHGTDRAGTSGAKRQQRQPVRGHGR